MTSTQRFLANDRNVLVGAALAATSVATIENAVLERPLARSGSAHIALSGAYTGQEEATYEIEITDTTVATPLISAPIFAGAGTGSISGIGFTGAAQTFTVKLADLGQVLTSAGTDMEGVSLVARSPGAAGNEIRLAIDLSGLTYAATNFSSIKAIPAGASDLSGPEYDWDTRVMGADGQIPTSAQRLVFGEDTSVIYRQYKQYKDGKWLYHFEPNLRRDIPQGTVIRFVTGSRTVTLTDGVDTEVYPGIVTLYDLLSAIQTTSALVKVEGVVSNDRAPDGMAARDLATRTDAHCLPPYGSGSGYAGSALIDYAALPGSSTELVEVRCWANSSKQHPSAGVGKELWQVKGSVSGLVESQLQTGKDFTWSNKFRFAVQSRLPDGFGVPRGRFSVSDIAYQPRAATEVEPPICVASLALGPESIDQSLTLTYKPRPLTGNCGCDSMTAPDLSGRACLTGLTYSSSSTGGTSMDPAHLMRATRLAIWYRNFVKANTAIGSDPAKPITAIGNERDIAIAAKSIATFRAALDDLYTLGVLAVPEWAANTAYANGAVIEMGDYRYAADGPGTSGAIEPVWPTIDGDTVADDGVWWECMGHAPVTMWDAAFQEMQNELGILEISPSGAQPATMVRIPKAFEVPVGAIDLTPVFAADIPAQTIVYYKETPQSWVVSKTTGIVTSATGGTYWLSSDGLTLFVGTPPNNPSNSFVTELLGHTTATGADWDIGTQPGDALMPVGARSLGDLASNETIAAGSVVYQGEGETGAYLFARLTQPLSVKADSFLIFNVDSRDSTRPITTELELAHERLGIYRIYNGGGYSGQTVRILLDRPEFMGFSYPSPGGFVWASEIAGGDDLDVYDAEFDTRYQAIMNVVRIAAGISKKADASKVAGDGCWRDTGAGFWWEITGSTGGAYAPAFTNEPYFSCRDAGGGYFSTHEFAFQLNIKCESALKEGDRITLSIGDAGWPSTYQVGDTLYLPVIAAQDLYLAGGKDGDNIQTWHVDGSVDGAYPAYLLDLDTPLPYNHLSLQLALTPGGIPSEAGDLYRFTVEGGHYRWRKDSGAWSAIADVGAVTPAIADGLVATITPGAAPSFAAGDLYRFRALQPSALSNVVAPDAASWQWAGATATLTANLGASKPIDCAAIAFHTLPSGATATLYGSADGIAWDWSESIPWRSGVMAALFAGHAASWLKLVIANATGGTIGWAWAGQALSTEHSAECQLRRDYSLERGTGLNPSAAFMGSTRSGDIEWQQGILTDTDMPNLLAMLDHLKTNDDEPMILIPQSTRTEEAYPVRVVLDSIDMPEDGGYQPNTGNERRYGMKLSVKGVVA